MLGAIRAADFYLLRFRNALKPVVVDDWFFADIGGVLAARVMNVRATALARGRGSVNFVAVALTRNSVVRHGEVVDSATKARTDLFVTNTKSLI
jgi:hypothetical protein